MVGFSLPASIGDSTEEEETGLCLPSGLRSSSFREKIDAPRSCRRSEELRCSSTPSASRSLMALTEFTGGKGQNSSDFILQQRHQSPAAVCTSADPRDYTQNVLQEEENSDRFLPSLGPIVSSLAGSRSAEHRLVGH